MKIEVQGYRSCRGNEGDAFSLTLVLDGKKAARVTYDGWGGEYRFDWTPGDKTVRPGATAARFLAYVDSLPPKDFGDGLGVMKLDADMVVGAAIDRMLEERALRRLCTTKLVFRLRGDEPGEWRTLRAPYRPAIAAALRAERGDALEEIANERFLAVAAPAARAGV
jgi:hypothetical protein